MSFLWYNCGSSNTMFFVNSKLFILLVFLSLNASICSSKEHVPVYMWSPKGSYVQNPALHRISEESFKHILSDKVKDNPLLIVFAEHTLSPEDFVHHDAYGKTPFENLHYYLKRSSVDYLPYVQNPIGAIKELGKGVTEISLASLSRNFELPKGEILIVDLNDAKDNEQRTQMLKRHDSAIANIYDEALKNNDNILALYTSHHTSWLAPEVVKHRNVRSLLQEKNETGESSKNYTDVPLEIKKESDLEGLLGDDENLLLYVSSYPIIKKGGKEELIKDLKVTNIKKGGNNTITFDLSNKDYNFNSEIKLRDDGYWTLAKVGTFKFPEIIAPMGFSYHCFNVSFTSETEILTLPGLQIQPFTTQGQHNFDDAYDCVGFTSIPIWTGIFVTVIMLLILTFGITFMMDIKTMDKFDDAKGKTITINASE
ncbi:V-type proton ATPase subunit S1 [Harmonia axyridis]|uniref:V-type proton ATPase subunit S1 n=1 Tax=Harmonia axyridis TaxID=115357 RepID=UPI001E278819|nr:V-type proton ATPase subunit S1 [Harmonia axyridis]